MEERYTSSREFFAAVRDAAIERERTRRMLDELLEGTALRGVDYSVPRVAGGCAGDGAGPLCAAIDATEAWRARVAEDEALMARGARVLYGDGGVGGLAGLLGSETADVLFFRCCCAMKWRAVEARLGRSRKWCAEREAVAYDYIDAHGMDAVAMGEGDAEG